VTPTDGSSSADAVALWDSEAATFDEAPDHGLLDAGVRAAWRSLLLDALPPAPASVADLGCGTGTLAVLLAEERYRVEALDFSPAMVALAREKVDAVPAGVCSRVSVRSGDAADPGLAPASVDVVLCRHVLWALPDPVAAVGRWVSALRPGGRLVLVEGNWSTGAGLTAARCAEIVGEWCDRVEVRPLPDPALWGRRITDERYLALARA
jgi:SAM-dependent methyltransferase